MSGKRVSAGFAACVSSDFGSTASRKMSVVCSRFGAVQRLDRGGGHDLPVADRTAAVVVDFRRPARNRLVRKISKLTCLQAVPGPVAVDPQRQRHDPVVDQVFLCGEASATSCPATACGGSAANSRTPHARPSCRRASGPCGRPRSAGRGAAMIAGRVRRSTALEQEPAELAIEHRRRIGLQVDAADRLRRAGFARRGAARRSKSRRTRSWTGFPTCAPLAKYAGSVVGDRADREPDVARASAAAARRSASISRLGQPEVAEVVGIAEVEDAASRNSSGIDARPVEVRGKVAVRRVEMNVRVLAPRARAGCPSAAPGPRRRRGRASRRGRGCRSSPCRRPRPMRPSAAGPGSAYFPVKTTLG